MTTVLVDGDIVAYRCAASCLRQGVVFEPVEVALSRINDLMYRIIQECEATKYEVYIGGTDNFRYEIYPEYKANRRDTAKPPALEACREQLLVEWNASIVNGMETDDMLGIRQSEIGGDSIIASIDKDLLCIEGKHYNFVKQEFYTISAFDGLRHFWFQMIMGDKSDNIPGYDGTARVKPPKFLQPAINNLYAMETSEEMEAYVKDMYTDKTQFEINKKLLCILTERPIETCYDNFTGNA